MRHRVSHHKQPAIFADAAGRVGKLVTSGAAALFTISVSMSMCHADHRLRHRLDLGGIHLIENSSRTVCGAPRTRTPAHEKTTVGTV
jgi:hypothetical protein